MTVLAVVLCVCATTLAGLLLVLRHLEKMRVTSGEVSSLLAAVESCEAHAIKAQCAATVRLAALEEKVTHLNNRMQR